MDGVGGLEGWRWIFIIEGLATLVVGVTTFWLLPNSPETAAFLTQQERQFLVDRLRSDTGTQSGHVNLKDKYHWPTIRGVLLDWKIWAAIVVYWVRLLPPALALRHRLTR
jgi:sugar phosphate permease